MKNTLKNFKLVCIKKMFRSRCFKVDNLSLKFANVFTKKKFHNFVHSVHSLLSNPHDLSGPIANVVSLTFPMSLVTKLTYRCNTSIWRNCNFKFSNWPKMSPQRVSPSLCSNYNIFNQNIQNYIVGQPNV